MDVTKEEPIFCTPVRYGHGIYEKNGGLYASIAGKVVGEDAVENKGLSLEIQPVNHRKDLVPYVGSICTCRVISVAMRQVKVSIKAIGQTKATGDFKGIIRREDIRATEKDKVEAQNCFRPGDIVLARVLSVGDNQWYNLATTENELGVVFAKSEAGGTLVPISWCEMQCNITMRIEARKVARKQSQFCQVVPGSSVPPRT